MEECLPRCSAEGSGDNLHSFVLDTLEEVDELLLSGAIGSEPELDTIAEDWKADGVECQSPISQVEALDGVAQYRQCLEGGACVVGHDPHMWFPVEAEMEEEP